MKYGCITLYRLHFICNYEKKYSILFLKFILFQNFMILEINYFLCVWIYKYLFTLLQSEIFIQNYIEFFAINHLIAARPSPDAS